jgi:hypothetical protein
MDAKPKKVNPWREANRLSWELRKDKVAGGNALTTKKKRPHQYASFGNYASKQGI